MTASARHDVLLLGATGITGRLALAHLSARCAETGASFAVGARRPERVRELCDEAGLPHPEIEHVDLDDDDALRRFAARGAVLLNLVGPYTRRGARVVDACLAAATSYVDLTAETQFVRGIDRLHERAVAAGIAVVQTSGFEALPADLAVHTARLAFAGQGDELAAADLGLEVLAAPGGGAISGGTAQSIREVLADPADPALSDVAFRIPDAHDAARVRAASPAPLRPRVRGGRVIAPMVPVSFINPPVLHRTSWLLARESGADFRPLRYRDGTVLGPASGVRGVVVLAAAAALSGAQAALLALGAAPRPVRRAGARALGAVLPRSGAGPSGPLLDRWRWRMLLVAGSRAGRLVRVTVDGDGHPGYTTTARMAGELALMIADGGGSGRTGCITPALAVGDDGALRLERAGLRVRVAP